MVNSNLTYFNMSPTEYDADIFFWKKILFFWHHGFRHQDLLHWTTTVTSFGHNCCFFRTQLMLHWTTTITSLDHNCHITETKLFQAEHFKLKSCSVNSMKCNSIVCDCLILSPPLIIAGVYVVVVQWRVFMLAAWWGVWSLHYDRCVLVRRKFKSDDETGMAAAHDRRKIHEKGKQRQHRGIIR